jgi:REP element-mobilizing transposase RayT
MAKQFRRKYNRLSSELYTGGYWYFVTICTTYKQCIFVAEGLPLQDNRFVLSPVGRIVESHLKSLSQKYSGVSLEDYVIMPNHIHAIISIEEDGQMSLSEIMRRLKAHVQVEVREKIREGLSLHKMWQKSFYDHIIRDDEDLMRIQEYIENNPKKWELDSLFMEMEG